MHVEVETSRGIARVRVSRKSLGSWYHLSELERDQKIIDFCFKKINSFTSGYTISVEKVSKLPRKKIVDLKSFHRRGLK